MSHWNPRQSNISEKEEFYWINTTLGNLTRALNSTFHPTKAKHAQRYLAQWQYKYHRRYEWGTMVVRRIFRSVKTAATPQWMLRLG